MSLVYLKYLPRFNYIKGFYGNQQSPNDILNNFNFYPVFYKLYFIYLLLPIIINNFILYIIL